MRRLFLPVGFVVLTAATFCLWQFRFVRDPGHPTIRLADLKPSAAPVPGIAWQGPADAPELVLSIRDGNPAQVVQRFSLPDVPPTRWLHLHYHVKASGLVPGPHRWSEGRLILEWHKPDHTWEFDPVDAARNNEDPGRLTVIARPNREAAVPALRIEHLGVSGEFRVLDFEATVVQERTLWKAGKWLLLLGWTIWFVGLAGPRDHPNRLRPLGAAALWLLMAVVVSIPGPWKTLRPLAVPFAIGPEQAVAAAPEPPANVPAVQVPSRSATPPAKEPDRTIAPTPPADKAKEGLVTPPPATSAGRIPPQGGPLLKFKNFIHQHGAAFKPFFHIPLLFGPTLLSLFLIGERRSRIIAIFTALTIEASQLAFGFGLDWIDALDLACDAIGILLALTTYRWLARRIRKNRTNRCETLML